MQVELRTSLKGRVKPRPLRSCEILSINEQLGIQVSSQISGYVYLYHFDAHSNGMQCMLTESVLRGPVAVQPAAPVLFPLEQGHGYDFSEGWHMLSVITSQRAFTDDDFEALKLPKCPAVRGGRGTDPPTNSGKDRPFIIVQDNRVLLSTRFSRGISELSLGLCIGPDCREPATSATFAAKPSKWPVKVCPNGAVGSEE
jgi:hypothetical protein